MVENMNILVLTSVYKEISLGNRDTSTNIVNSFVHDWVKQGHNVIVIHNSHCYPRLIHMIPLSLKNKLATKMGFSIPDYDAVKKKEYLDEGARIYRLAIKKIIPHKSPSTRALITQTNKINEILKNINFVPEIITGHWASPQIEIISELKKVYNCKTACVLHGTGYINDPKFNTKKYLAGIDHLGCRSLSQSKQVKEILNLERLPFVCNSGVPDKYLENYSLNVSKFENVKKWKFTYVGRLVAYKNIDATIKALSKLENSDWEFNIVGDGAERENLEKLAKTLNCSDNVKFWGRVPRDQVMEILKNTHVFVMISTNEIFGLVYLEAMAASCITIASKYGGVDGIIIDRKNGYLCSEGDSAELSSIINKVIFSKSLNDIKSIVSQGYQTANEYSDSKVALKYINIITD